ncbi:MAG: hypothetical protein LQ340_007635 [Diploschistes diacapsis]|nr:MAG: hypothetical protein LQ340_007635 [Diploschistes diacapsis]
MPVLSAPTVQSAPLFPSFFSRRTYLMIHVHAPHNLLPVRSLQSNTLFDPKLPDGRRP